MPKIRVRDRETGRTDTIDWNQDRPPTREEIKTILAGGVNIPTSQMGDYGQTPQDVGAPMPTAQNGGSSWLNDVVQFGSDAMSGIRSSAARTIYGGGDLIRRGVNAIMPDQPQTMEGLVTGEKRRPFMERIIDKPDVQAAMTAPDTWGGTVGSVGGDIAQFAIPGANVTRAAKGLSMAGRLGVEGLMGAGVAGIQSAGDPYKMATGAGIGIVAPPIAGAIGRAASPYVNRWLGRGAQSGVNANAEAADTLLGKPNPWGEGVSMNPAEAENIMVGRGPRVEPGADILLGATPRPTPPPPPRPMQEWEAQNMFGGPDGNAGAPTPQVSPWAPPTQRSSRQLPTFAASRGSRFLGAEEGAPIDITSPIPAAAEGQILAGSGATEAARAAGRRTKAVRGPAGKFRRPTDDEALALPREDNAPPFVDLPPERQAPYLSLFEQEGRIQPPRTLPAGLGDSEYMSYLRSVADEPEQIVRRPTSSTGARSSVPTREYVGNPDYEPRLGRVDSPDATPRDTALADLLDSIGRNSSEVPTPLISGPTRAQSRDAMRNSLDVGPPQTPTRSPTVQRLEAEFGRELTDDELKILGESRVRHPFGNERGEINPELARHLGGGVFGGAYGGLHGETKEERLRNAALGAGLGFGLSVAPTLGKKGGSQGAFRQRPAITQPKPNPFTTMGRGRIKGEVKDLLNAPRAIMASTDLSAPLRQGATMLHRPEYWKALPDMVRAFKNEDTFTAIQNEIASRDSFKKMREAGLALSDMAKDSTKLSDREELYMSRLAERIPGAGRIIRASGRGYVAFLNKLRADSFDALIREAGGSSDAKKIADYINNATGRGRLPNVPILGDLEKSAEALNGVLFSPRLMASRIQMLNPANYMQADPFVRKQYLKSIASFGGAVTAALTLAKGAGAEVETDPRSSDFAKIKLGNIRVDIGAGFQQYVRAASQLVSGQMKDLESGRIKDLTKKNARYTRKDVVQNFLEAKASPLLGLMIDWSEGKTFTGDKFQLLPEGATEGKIPNREEFFKSQLGRRLTPMILQDLYDLYDEDPDMVGLIGPAAFGAGVNVHKRRSSRVAQ